MGFAELVCLLRKAEDIKLLKLDEIIRNIPPERSVQASQLLQKVGSLGMPLALSIITYYDPPAEAFDVLCEVLSKERMVSYAVLIEKHHTQRQAYRRRQQHGIPHNPQLIRYVFAKP